MKGKEHRRNIVQKNKYHNGSQNISKDIFGNKTSAAGLSKMIVERKMSMQWYSFHQKYTT